MLTVFALLVSLCSAQWDIKLLISEAVHKVEEYDRCKSGWSLLSWRCRCPIHEDYLLRVEAALASQLFGQPRARELILDALEAHDFTRNHKPTVIHIAGVSQEFGLLLTSLGQWGWQEPCVSVVGEKPFLQN